jgi:lipopolysaccharide transport system ATP-binding protein
MSDVIIKVDNLSKQYQIGAREGYKTFRETLVDAAKAPFQQVSSLLNPKSKTRNPKYETIWALKDVSFDVKQGEVLGIIGRNGAGKSTLLKILSKITEPTEGRVELKGRVGSLLEVGTGFHPELTGHENVYLYGAILGMNRWEVTRKFDEIIAFAELEKFVDTPVKRYSSGMYMRLAFAVAAHLEPEILFVDEVLAVGDAAFQKKCLGKMDGVSQEGRTILFVSHNMGAINRLCRSTLWIDQGRLLTFDSTEQVVSKYLTSNTNETGAKTWETGISNSGVDELKIYKIQVLNCDGKPTSSLDVRKHFEVEIHYRITKRLPYFRVGFLLSTADGISAFEAYDADEKRYSGSREPGDFITKCRVPGNLLNVGNYILTINGGIPNIKNLVYLENVLTVRIEDTGAIGSHLFDKRQGVVRPRLEWVCREIK